MRDLKQLNLERLANNGDQLYNTAGNAAYYIYIYI